MMQKILLILAIVLLSYGANAQTLNDPVYINHSLLPKTDFDSKDGNVTTNLIEVNVTTPAIKVSKK